MSQNEQVLAWLKHGPVTAAYAVERGVYRLAARIKDLRDKGYQISSEIAPNRKSSHHAVYSLEA